MIKIFNVTDVALEFTVSSYSAALFWLCLFLSILLNLGRRRRNYDFYSPLECPQKTEVPDMGSLYFFVIFAIILPEKCFSLMGDFEYDTRLNIRIDHSFESSHTPFFTRRGDIVAKSVHSDTVTFKQIELTQENVISVKALAKNNGNYKIRALVKLPDGKEFLFFSFVKACSLVESHLSDVLFINLDSTGNVIAVTLAVHAVCTGANVEDKNLLNFNTTVLVRHMDIGPVPDTASYIQKLEREREAKERGEGKDNRSFLSKYWMYIVPAVILILISSSSNNEAGGNPQR